MKYAKYVIAALSLLAAACKNDPVDNNAMQGQREALLATSEIGIYQNGSAVLRFDKTTHQLGVSPAKYQFRILDNAGMQYVEITLGAIPQGSVTVTGEVSSKGYKLSNLKMQDVVLLKQEGELLWLWSDATHTGMILPWFEL